MKKINNIPMMMLIVSIFLFTGCGLWDIDKGHYNECTYTIDGELTSLDISGGADVVVDTTIAKNQVRVLANTDDFSKLVVKAENGKLVISNKRNIGYKEYNVYVPAFDYKALVVAGGSDMEWNCCDVDELAVVVSGGADCEVKGKCNTLSLVASGGADADLDELIADDASVVASGGSDVELHVVSTISLTASGGSDIYVKGTPQILGWNVSGGSDVHINK